MLPLAFLSIILGAAAVLAVPSANRAMEANQMVQIRTDVMFAGQVRQAAIQYMRDNPAVTGEVTAAQLAPYMPLGLSVDRSPWSVWAEARVIYVYENEPLVGTLGALGEYGRGDFGVAQVIEVPAVSGGNPSLTVQSLADQGVVWVPSSQLGSRLRPGAAVWTAGY